MNKFEQISSDGHQMSLAAGQGWGQGGVPHVHVWRGPLYSEVQ